MIRGCCVLIISLWMIVVLTSCWDRNELNDIAIAVGMGLDKQDDQVQVTVQIVNPGEVAANKGGGGYSPPITTYSTSEATLLEAIRKLTTAAPRQIFTSHLRILVIGEQLAREGIVKVLDGIDRNYQMRSDFYIIIARETTAKDVLGVLTTIEKIPANKMFTMLEMSEEVWAPTTNVKIDDFIQDVSSPTKDAVLTGIRIIGDQEAGKTLKNLEKTEPPATLQYSGIALFKKDKLIDWLDEDESKGFNYIMGNVNNTVGHSKCPEEGVFGVEVTRSQSIVKGKIVRGKPKILIDLYTEENISEVQCKLDLTKPETILKLEKLAEENMKKILEAAIDKAKKNKTDIFGFGNFIEDASPKAWTMLKDDWDKEFANLDISINVDVKIRRLGTINNPLQERSD